MKKALAILMALAMIVPAVFATGPAPEVTFGLSAKAEVQMIKENTTDTFENSGGASQPVGSFNPKGLKVTEFVTDDWVNFDWAPMSIKAEGKWDAYSATDEDWSWLKVTATWKDLFGFKIDYNYSQDNKELDKDNPVYTGNATAIDSENTSNEIVATYDKDGVKFWTKYDANAVLDMLSVNVGTQADSFLNDFKEIGFEFTNDEVATKLVYKNVPSMYGATIDAATIEAKNLFGFWSVLLNDADEFGYRLANLDSDSKIDRPEYKIGKDNKIQDPAKAAMNARNTMKFGENLTIKLGLVVPSTDMTFTNWLKGDNAIVGAEYVLADVGTIGAGAKIKQDYVVSDGTKSGNSLFILDGKTGIQWGNAFWLDAKLDKLLGEDKAVFVGVDAQFGAYDQTFETAKHTDATKVNEWKIAMATKANLYAETKMKLSDMISFSAGTLFSLGTGYDYKAVTGTSWSDANKWTDLQKADTWYSDSITEANEMNAVYGITPFELKVRADVKVNDTVSVWVSDNFKANAGYFGDKNDDGTFKYTQWDYAGTNSKEVEVRGAFQKNVLGLGAKFKATEKSSLTVSTDINIYLGLPEASNLYREQGAMNSDQYTTYKKNVDAELAVWKSKNFNPFAVKVAYSYAY